MLATMADPLVSVAPVLATTSGLASDAKSLKALLDSSCAQSETRAGDLEVLRSRTSTLCEQVDLVLTNLVGANTTAPASAVLAMPAIIEQIMNERDAIIADIKVAFHSMSDSRLVEGGLGEGASGVSKMKANSIKKKNSCVKYCF